MIPKHYYMLIDTEGVRTEKGNLCYDIGIIIIDRKNKLYAKYSFIVKEIYYSNLMNSYYYKLKRKLYDKEISEGKRKVLTFATIQEVVRLLIDKWNCQAAIGHYMRYDKYSLDDTTKFLLNKEKFFIQNIPLWCTYTMARQIYSCRPTFKSFCGDKLNYSAENLYRYITNNSKFNESHTGLEDALIEKEIFYHILRQHKKIRKTYYIEG